MASYYNEARKHEKKLRRLQREVSRKQCRAHDAALLLVSQSLKNILILVKYKKKENEEEKEELTTAICSGHCKKKRKLYEIDKTKNSSSAE